nr:nuclear transport factor 2 family protein [Hahella sp. CCB-MM4]
MLEEQLRRAMIDSDLSTLDQLLADDLIFTNHLGQVMSKQDDLEAHRTGFVNIHSIVQSVQITRSQEEMAIVSVHSHICGEFGGMPSDVSLRFTRIWQRRNHQQWQVVAAHSTLVQEI